ISTSTLNSVCWSGPTAGRFARGDGLGWPASQPGIFCGTSIRLSPAAPGWLDSTRRDMRAIARPRLGPTLVDRHIAVVDPLLIHPFPAQALLASPHCRRASRVRCWLAKAQAVLSMGRHRQADCEEGANCCYVQCSHDGI